MKFEDALTVAVNKEKLEEKKEDIVFDGIEPKTLKILSLLWNMIAASGGKFDDLVYVTSRGDLVSMPIKEKKKTTEGEIVTENKD